MFMSRKPRLDAYIIHYAGLTRDAGWASELPPGTERVDLIRRDLDAWRLRGFLAEIVEGR
jgi:hypothetical protein